MSTITEYARLDPDQLARLRHLLADSPQEAYEYAGDLENTVDTDKAWAGLQHLLAKAGTPIDVIAGGTRMSEHEWAYDPPRLFSPDEVVAAARFLAATPVASLAELYDPAELEAADVYPNIWNQEWALSYLEDYYADLVAFFGAAAAAGQAVLTWQS
jgi:Domain of unknown function (DUF1877)